MPGRRSPARQADGAGQPARRGPLLVIGLLVAAAIAGGIWVVAQRAAPPPALPVATPRPSPPPPPTQTPEPPPASTSTMSEAQFQSEVARRVAQEMKRLEKASKTKPAKGTPTEADAATTRTEPTPGAPGGAPEGGAAAASPTEARPTPVLEPTEAPARAAAPALLADVDTSPKIQTVVKPVYPPFALRARIKGIVVLRVLVGETGTPLDVEVVQGVSGLTEAALEAVRRWKFTPARRNGAPVRAWTTVPIPFEP